VQDAPAQLCGYHMEKSFLGLAAGFAFVDVSSKIFVDRNAQELGIGRGNLVDLVG